MTGTTVFPSASGTAVRRAVSPDLAIPTLPDSIARDAADAPPLLLSPLGFVEQAWLGRNAWWRYLLAVLLFVALVLTGAAALLAAGAFVLAELEGLRSTQVALRAFYNSGTAVFTWLMLVAALELPILFLVVRRLHRRPARSLIVGPRGFDWSGFAHSLGLALAIGSFGVFVEQIVSPGTMRLVYDAERFWPFVGLALVLVPLQTLAEEAIFRGYVLQGVARLSRRFAVRLVVPAVAFAALHLNNAAATHGGLWGALEFVVLALYLTFLALRGDGIEHAWGFHLGNNLLAFLLVASPASDFSLPSLFVTDEADFFAGFVATIVICLLHYGLLLRFSAPRLARRSSRAAPDVLAGAARL